MFTLNMTFIFSKIREYVFRDPHSISFMFPTLSYNQSGSKQVDTYILHTLFTHNDSKLLALFQWLK